MPDIRCMFTHTEKWEEDTASTERNSAISRSRPPLSRIEVSVGETGRGGQMFGGIAGVSVIHHGLLDSLEEGFEVGGEWRRELDLEILTGLLHHPLFLFDPKCH